MSGRFGFALTALWFGAGAQVDLAISALGGDSEGAVQILYGSAAGLSADNDQIWSQDQVGVAGDGKSTELFGFALDGTGSPARP